MTDQSFFTQVILNEQGRLVLPAQARRTLNLKGRQVLILRIEKDRLVLQKPEEIKTTLKAPFIALRKQGISLADELIEERHQEAKREMHDS